MNVEAYRYGGHRRNLRVQEGLAAAPMFPVAVPVAAAGSFLQISHAIPRSENTREFKTAEYQRSDFKPKIQSGELHEKLLRQSQGLATVLVATGTAPVTWRYTRYVALHPIRTGAMPTDRVQCLRIGCTAQRSTTPKKSLPPRTHHPQTGTRSHKNPKHRRCGGRRRDRRARPRYWWRLALHPLRGDAPVTWRYTRSERVQCLRIGCTAQRTNTPKKSLPPRTHYP